MSDKIISIPKLKGSEDYSMWSIRVESLLAREDLDLALEDDKDPGKTKKALGTIRLLCKFRRCFSL